MTVDGPDILEALAAAGIQGRLLDGGGRLEVRAEDLGAIGRALETWTQEHGLPFVPFEVDDHTVVLAPPPG